MHLRINTTNMLTTNYANTNLTTHTLCQCVAGCVNDERSWLTFRSAQLRLAGSHHSHTISEGWSKSNDAINMSPIEIAPSCVQRPLRAGVGATQRRGMYRLVRHGKRRPNYRAKVTTYHGNMPLSRTMKSQLYRARTPPGQLVISHAGR